MLLGELLGELLGDSCFLQVEKNHGRRRRRAIATRWPSAKGGAHGTEAL